MDDRPKKLTIRALAKQLDLSIATVSLALRNSPRIAKATRERVQAAAAGSGYIINPSIAQLMQHIRSARPVVSEGVLGLLNFTSTRQMADFSPFHRELQAGIEGRAQQLGFSVDSFWWHQPRTTPARLHQILQARGIRGLLICPPHDVGFDLPMPVDEFSMVTYGYGLHSPHINRVAPNQSKNITLCLHMALKRGYRRIGLIIDPVVQEKMGFFYAMVFSWFADLVPPQDRIRPFMGKPFQQEAFLKWFTESAPEVIITTSPQYLVILHSIGVRVPEDTAYIIQNILNLDYLRKPPYDLAICGVDTCTAHSGAKMVDIVTSQLLRNETGLPSLPQVVMTDVLWREGDSLPEIGEPLPIAETLGLFL